jgi:hypothetical protein
MFDGGELSDWKKNALQASKELNWQREQEVVRSIYSALL